MNLFTNCPYCNAPIQPDILHDENYDGHQHQYPEYVHCTCPIEFHQLQNDRNELEGFTYDIPDLNLQGFQTTSLANRTLRPIGLEVHRIYYKDNAQNSSLPIFTAPVPIFTIPLIIIPTKENIQRIKLWATFS